MILIGRQLDFTLDSEIDWSTKRRNKKRVQHGQNHSMCSCQGAVDKEEAYERTGEVRKRRTRKRSEEMRKHGERK